MILLVSLLLLAPGAQATLASGEAFKSAQRHFLLGALMERRGDSAGALKAFEAALGEDPDSLYLRREAAGMALELGDSEKAGALAGRLKEKDAADPKTQLLLGNILWARGDEAGTRAAFEEAFRLDPHSAEAVLSLGEFLSERDPDQAREVYRRFIQSDPDEASEARYELAKMDYEAGRYEAAISQLKDAIEEEPDALPLRYALAQAYEAQASTAAALGEYQRILQMEPSNTALLNRIGELSAATGDLDQARARFAEARRLEPQNPAACHWLAADAEKLGDWSRAAELLGASAALAEDPALHLRLSYYETQAGRGREAMRVLEAAHARWPANDQIDYFLALGYDDMKKPQKAVALLRQVLELKPEMREARFELGAILEKLNRLDEAEKEFRALLASDPNDAAALNYLGFSLADRGMELSTAEALIRRALSLKPENPAYLDSLGWVLFQQGRSTEAVSSLEEAIAGDPVDGEIFSHLGDALASAGRTGEAWLSFKRAELLSEDPAVPGKKAARIQKGFDPSQLGELYLRHLDAVHGRWRKMSAVCRAEVQVVGRRFSHDGILSLGPSGELTLEILGPLFTPLWRARAGSDGFSMDAVPGADPDQVRGVVEGLLSSLRAYLVGDLFAARPAIYHKGWFKRSIIIGDRRLDLDADGQRLAAVVLPEGKGKILFSDLAKAAGGRLVPRRISWKGRFGSVTLNLEQVQVDFMDEKR